MTNRSIMLITLFFLVISTISPTMANADSNPINNENIALENDIYSLKKEYGFETFVINNSSSTKPSDTIEFNSVDEFENFLQDLQKKQQETVEIEIPVSSASTEVVNQLSINNTEPISTQTTTYTRNGYLINWWAPIQNGKIVALSFKNVRFNYKYKFVNNKPQFVSLSNFNSYLTGVNLDIDWIHRTGNYTLSKKTNTKDKANITVEGTYVLGVVIAGYPIGFRWGGTWKCSLTLV